METLVRTPLEVFNLSQYLNVPLYQRSYVWDEQEQWEPLWSDIRRTTELRLGPVQTATHFLGAVVLQVLGQKPGQVQQGSVVDEQQILTTLQLVMDATSAQLDARGLTRQASQLRKLTHNAEDDVERQDDVLKIRHSGGDHEPYVEVTEAPAPVDYDDLDAPDGKPGNAYFASRVSAWPDGEPEDMRVRADGLVNTLRNGLQIVTISPRSTEDSQEIFETLSTRGLAGASAADSMQRTVVGGVRRVANVSEDVQRTLAAVALRAPAGTDFAVAGAGAIREHGLTARPTQDVDLFTARMDPVAFAVALDDLLGGLGDHGWCATVVRQAPTFARLQVTDPDGAQVEADLAVHWRGADPVVLAVSPVLALPDPMASELGALSSRVEVRDLLNVDASRRSGGFTDDEFMGLLADRDAGFKRVIFADRLGLVGRVRPAEVADYGVDAAELAHVQQRLTIWTVELKA